MALYEIALMGEPSQNQVDELRQAVSDIIELFGLQLDKEVTWSVQPDDFEPSQRTVAAIAFFGGASVSLNGMGKILGRRVPILPIVSDYGRVSIEIPDRLRSLNCLSYKKDGPQRIATALLECVGLLPRQRRVFVSYRRTESREAALQLFDELSARLFDVFLDTHGIAPGEDFQAMLWHRLCDSDVLIMLDTTTYFESRWTSTEFGRALAKNIQVLRVGWPSVNPSPRTSTASRIDLAANEIDMNTGLLAEGAIERICVQLEIVRSQSHAVRHLNLFSNLKQAVECIKGRVIGVGIHNAVHIELPNKQEIVVYPTVGVPTSRTLHDAFIHAPNYSAAVVYDHIGLHPDWIGHLDWLSEHIPAARWVKASEAAWTLAGWEGL